MSSVFFPTTSLSGTIPSTNFPALTGDVTTTAGSVATSLVATSNSTLTTLSSLTTASSLSSVGTITSGTWNGTTIAIANGGTGQTTKSAAFNALSPLTTTGDLLYANGTNSNTRLAGNTTVVKNFLTQTGNGSISAAPTWGTISAGDVPILNQNTTGTASNVTGIVAVVNGGTGVSTTSQNYVFAGPTSGSGAPTFRLLTAGDIPTSAAAGSTGDVQFNTAGALDADDTNFFWDNTDKSLGVRNNTPSSALTMGSYSGNIALEIHSGNGGPNPTTNGQAFFSGGPGAGAYMQGQGSVYDCSWVNSAGNYTIVNPAGTPDVLVMGSITMNGSSSGSFTQQAAATTTPYTVTWPATQGAAGTVLTDSDGAGTLTWTTPSSSPSFTTFAMANNQSTPTDVTGFLLDHTVAQVYYIYSQDYVLTTGAGGAEARTTLGTYVADYLPVAGTWKLNPLNSTADGFPSPQPAFSSISITNTGQIQYTTGDATNGGTTGTFDHWNLYYAISAQSP